MGLLSLTNIKIKNTLSATSISSKTWRIILTSGLFLSYWVAPLLHDDELALEGRHRGEPLGPALEDSSPNWRQGLLFETQFLQRVYFLI